MKMLIHFKLHYNAGAGQNTVGIQILDIQKPESSEKQTLFLKVGGI